MTKYRLKDRELQAKLDEISNGDFTDKLETEARRKFVDILNREVIQVFFGDFDIFANRYSVVFELSEVEEVSEYDPHAWNEWPTVEPPNGELMRVEYVDIDNRHRKGCAVFYPPKSWLDYNGKVIKGVNAIRFRPWEEEEE